MASLRTVMNLLKFHGQKVSKRLAVFEGYANYGTSATPCLNQMFSSQRNSSSLTQYTSNEKIVSDDFFPNVPLSELGIRKNDALDICEEDVSEFSPPLEPSMNFAAYVNKSPSLQELVKLGVKLYKFEHNVNLCNYILSLDYERNVKHHLLFLHSIGVPGDSFGNFITKNPYFFKEDLDNLQIRVNYLESKHFKPDGITRIVTLCPTWLSHVTQEIDSRLGFFQQTFSLFGREVRELTVKRPSLILRPTENISRNIFAFKEQMGFEDKDLKSLILAAPQLYAMCSWKLMDAFDVLHNEVKLPHDVILKNPKILSTKPRRIKARHQFLKLLNRDQYDPKKENYVSPTALLSGTDVEFCEKVAKTSVDAYNTFLKSL